MSLYQHSCGDPACSDQISTLTRELEEARRELGLLHDNLASVDRELLDTREALASARAAEERSRLAAEAAQAREDKAIMDRDSARAECAWRGEEIARLSRRMAMMKAGYDFEKNGFTTIEYQQLWWSSFAAQWEAIGLHLAVVERWHEDANVHWPKTIRERDSTVKQALPFVRRVHRRLPKCQGAMWAVGVSTDQLVGVAVVGHPARELMEDNTLGVLRVAVIPGNPNACSMLYGACSRAAKAMGADNLVTYTHLDEYGASLKASNWIEGGETDGGEWIRPNQPQRQNSLAIDPLPKRRWWAPWSKRVQQENIHPNGFCTRGERRCEWCRVEAERREAEGL